MNDTQTHKLFTLFRLLNALKVQIEPSASIQSLVSLLSDALIARLLAYQTSISPQMHEAGWQRSLLESSSAQASSRSHSPILTRHLTAFFGELLAGNPCASELWVEMEKSRKRQTCTAVQRHPYLATTFPPVLELIQVLEPFIQHYETLAPEENIHELMQALNFTEVIAAPEQFLYLHSPYSDITNTLSRFLQTMMVSHAIQNKIPIVGNLKTSLEFDALRNRLLINGEASEETQKSIKPCYNQFCLLGSIEQYLRSGYLISMDLCLPSATSHTDLSVREKEFLYQELGWASQIQISSHEHNFGHAEVLTSGSVTLQAPLPRVGIPFKNIQAQLEILPSNTEEEPIANNNPLLFHTLHILQLAHREIADISPEELRHQTLKKRELFQTMVTSAYSSFVVTAQEWDSLNADEQAGIRYLERAAPPSELLSPSEIANQLLACAHPALLIAIQHCVEDYADQISLPGLLDDLNRELGTSNTKIMMFWLALYREESYQILLTLHAKDLLPFAFSEREADALAFKYPQQVIKRPLTEDPREARTFYASPITLPSHPPPQQLCPSGQESILNFKQLRLAFALGKQNLQEIQVAFDDWVQKDLSHLTDNEIEWICSLETSLPYFLEHPEIRTTLEPSLPRPYQFLLALEDRDFQGFEKFSPTEHFLWFFKYNAKIPLLPLDFSRQNPKYADILLCIYHIRAIPKTEAYLTNSDAYAKIYLSAYSVENLDTWSQALPQKEALNVLTYYLLSSVEKQKKLCAHPPFLESIYHILENLPEIDSNSLLSLHGLSQGNVNLIASLAHYSSHTTPGIAKLIAKRLNVYLNTARLNLLQILILSSIPESHDEVKKLIENAAATEQVFISSQLPNFSEIKQSLEILETMLQQQSSILLRYLNNHSLLPLMYQLSIGDCSARVLVILLKYSDALEQAPLTVLQTSLKAHLKAGMIFLCHLRELLFFSPKLHVQIKDYLLNYSHFFTAEQAPEARDIADFLKRTHAENLRETPLAKALFNPSKLSSALLPMDQQEIAKIAEYEPTLRECVPLYQHTALYEKFSDPTLIQAESIIFKMFLYCQNFSQVSDTEERLQVLGELEKTNEHQIHTFIPLVYLAHLMESERPLSFRLDIDEKIISAIQNIRGSRPYWLSQSSFEKLLGQLGGYLKPDPYNAFTLIQAILETANIPAIQQPRLASDILRHLSSQYLPLRPETITTIFQKLGPPFMAYFEKNQEALLSLIQQHRTYNHASSPMRAVNGLLSRRTANFSTPSPASPSLRRHSRVGSIHGLTFTPPSSPARSQLTQKPPAGTPPPSPGGSGKPG